VSKEPKAATFTTAVVALTACRKVDQNDIKNC